MTPTPRVRDSMAPEANSLAVQRDDRDVRETMCEIMRQATLAIRSPEQLRKTEGAGISLMVLITPKASLNFTRLYSACRR